MNEKSSEPSEVMRRLKAKAEARAIIINDIARILWENGEMLADTEDGAMPGWDDLMVIRHADDASQDQRDTCWAWFMNHWQRAEALLTMQAADSLVLAKHLIDSAMRTQKSVELDLWHKIERAKGFEPGSLTGAPGVPQKVAL